MLHRVVRPFAVTACAAIGALCCAATVHAGIVKHLFGPQQRIWTVSGTDFSTTSSQTPVRLTGATVTIVIPPGPSQLVVARFTAESECRDDANPGNWCVVTILAEGSEMEPVVGGDFGFDTAPQGGRGYWRGHAMDRSLVLQPGTYRIRVMFNVTAASTVFVLDDWHLTVESYLPPS